MYEKKKNCAKIFDLHWHRLNGNHIVTQIENGLKQFPCIVHQFENETYKRINNIYQKKNKKKEKGILYTILNNVT